MKKIKTFYLLIIFIMSLGFVACSNNPSPDETTVHISQPLGQIYLFGESHSNEKILKKELELWHEYYNNENMRHLLIEYPYYTAEFLNIWMRSSNDEILYMLFRNLAGTQADSPVTKEFYQKIKSDYPETIFHGTDVGHQYDTTGKRFLDYLKENNLEDSEQYLLTQESIEQGKYYSKNYDNVYRENKMTENFIREFDNLNGESVMGIYGNAHTDFDAMDYLTKTVPCMANQLKEHYKDNIHSEDLSWLKKDIEPERIDMIMINEKEYEASYFGKVDLTGFEDYKYREFWRLEDAYEDFNNNPKTGNVLPYDDYPMLIEPNQIFIIDYTRTDDSVTKVYFRSDGHISNDLPSTEEFTIEP